MTNKIIVVESEDDCSCCGYIGLPKELRRDIPAILEVHGPHSGCHYCGNFFRLCLGCSKDLLSKLESTIKR